MRHHILRGDPEWEVILVDLGWMGKERESSWQLGVWTWAVLPTAVWA